MNTSTWAPPAFSARGLSIFLSSFAQVDVPLPTYEIRSVNDSINVDGLLTEPAWQQTPVIDAFSYPWFKAGQKERTEVRMLWDPSYLYVFFKSHDAFISSHLTQRDDPVSRDDCVEVFIAPDTSRIENYFNFEFNAITTILTARRLDRANGTQMALEPQPHWGTQ